MKATSAWMRTFLGLLMIAAAMLPLRVSQAATEATPPASPPATQPASILTTLKHDHPRLLASKADFTRIRQLIQTDPLAQAWHDRLLAQARTLADTKPFPMHITQGQRMVLQGTGELRDRMYLLGLLYQLHGDASYVDLAWRHMQPALELEEWNERHFLGVAETTRALAIAYDWLYAGLSDEQRRAIVRAIADKGITPAMRAYQGRSVHGWWPAVTTNWNQVCNGGIGIGALAIADDEPKLAGDALWYILRLLPIAMNSYAPQGAWNEGLAYWEYGSDYNVQFIACLDSALGTDFGLSQLPGFAQTGYYPIHLTGPTGLGFNFGDAGQHLRIHSPIQLWLAKRFNQPLVAQSYLPHARSSVLDLLWYDPALAKRAESADLRQLPVDHHYRVADTFTFRSQWNNPKALFVAFKGGSNKDNHAHVDLGTFVLDALGQRWVMDLGTDSYWLPGYFKQERWSYYRVRAESHNTLIINPDANPGQDLKAKASLLAWQRDEVSNQAWATLDLTQAYRSQQPAPKKVTRTILRDGGKQVRITDVIQPAPDDAGQPMPTRAHWQIHTAAQIILDDTGLVATLTLQDQRLRVVIHQPKGVQFTKAPASPLPTSPNPSGQASNAGISRLSVDLTKPLSQGDVELVITFEPVQP